MRIGIDARLYYESGVGRYIKNLLTELDEYASQHSKHSYYIFLSGRGFREISFKSSTLIKVHADVAWHSIREQLDFLSIVNKHNLDVMHFTYFSLPLLYRRKFVVTIHDLIINNIDTGRATTLPLPLYRLKRFGYKKIMEHAVHNSRFIISPSNSTKRSIEETYSVDPKKIVVIPEGIDAAFSTVPKRVEKKLPLRYILYVGNAYPHKNLERLIKAKLSLNTEEASLILVGRDDYFYKQLRKKYGSEKAVMFLSDVDDSMLSYLYSHAEFLVSPALMEGFGLTPLEAMARECLPVVSDIPAFREVCEDAAIYFNPENPDAIAKALLGALQLDSKERLQYKKAALDRVKKYSWRSALLQTVEVYERSARI